MHAGDEVESGFAEYFFKDSVRNLSCAFNCAVSDLKVVSRDEVELERVGSSWVS